MKIIRTKTELIDLFKSLNGGTIINVATTTTVKTKKTNNPYADCIITRKTKCEYQFGYSYQNAVNNRLEKQGNERVFQSGNLAWGKWLVENKLISYKDEFYARCYKFANTNSSSEYFINGKRATENETNTIKSVLATKSNNSNTQSSAGLNTNQVVVRNLSFNSINEIKVNGEDYIIDFTSNNYGVTA